MDVEVQASALEAGRQELALWLTGYGILDAQDYLFKVRSLLRVSERLPVAARVPQDERSEVTGH